jgi:hypothetical protein
MLKSIDRSADRSADDSLLESCGNYAFQFKDDSLEQSGIESSRMQNLDEVNIIEFKQDTVDRTRQRTIETSNPESAITSVYQQESEPAHLMHTQGIKLKDKILESTLRQPNTVMREAREEEKMIELLPRQQDTLTGSKSSLQSSQNTADFTKDIQRENVDATQTDLSSFPNVNVDDINFSKQEDLSNIEKQDTLGNLIFNKQAINSPAFKPTYNEHRQDEGKSGTS